MSAKKTSKCLKEAYYPKNGQFKTKKISSIYSKKKKALEGRNKGKNSQNSNI